jgi:hypothetical protein
MLSVVSHLSEQRNPIRTHLSRKTQGSVFLPYHDYPFFKNKHVIIIESLLAHVFIELLRDLFLVSRPFPTALRNRIRNPRKTDPAAA